MNADYILTLVLKVAALSALSIWIGSWVKHAL